MRDGGSHQQASENPYHPSGRRPGLPLGANLPSVHCSGGQLNRGADQVEGSAVLESLEVSSGRASIRVGW